MKALFTTSNPLNVEHTLAYVFNAPRPLSGVKVINNGDWLAGRFWALCDREDDIKTNLSLDAYRVFTVTDGVMKLLAESAIPERYRGQYNAMDDGKKEQILAGYYRKINEGLDADRAVMMLLSLGDKAQLELVI